MYVITVYSLLNITFTFYVYVQLSPITYRVKYYFFFKHLKIKMPLTILIYDHQIKISGQQLPFFA